MGTSPNQLFLPGPRLLVWILFILAIANGVFLYFIPILAETHYAWSIKPAINAATMGAGYLAGMLATGLAIFAVRYWRSVRVLMGPFAFLGLSLFAATLLHQDRFKWDYWLTWIWTGVYAFLPIGTLLIWWWQERLKPEVPPLDGSLKGFRLVALVSGVALLLPSIWLYVQPQAFLELWPWAITPLLGRVFAGWYLFAALLLVFSSQMVRQPHEVPIVGGTLALWSLLLLLLPLIYPQSIFTERVGFWLWSGVHLAVLLYTGWIALFCLQRMKSSGQTL